MYSNCPFCFSSKSTSSVFENTFFNKKVFEYRKCVQCKLVYIQPFPSIEDFVVMYPPSYQSEVKSEAESSTPHNNILELIGKYTVKKKLLDYGCGSGSFVLQAAAKNFDCFGVEFSPLLVEMLLRGIKKVKFQTITEFEKNEEKFDIIHMSNVLEHLINPNEVMQQLRLRMNENGIFIIYGPIENNFSFAFLVRKVFFFTRKYFLGRTNSHAPTHILYSNSVNQRKFFESLGLEEQYFEIKESAWPFPEDLKQAKGLQKIIMFYIAKSSILLSKVCKKFGNTFVYVGRLKVN